MAAIALQFDTRSIDRLADNFAAIAAEVDDTTPLMDEIGSYLEFSIARRFELERGPDGIPWPATRRGTSILKGSPPRLASSMTRRAERERVSVGTNVIYARIHQQGGTIKPKRGRFLRFTVGGQTFFVKSVTIPARPFLGIDQADREAIGEVVEDYLRDVFAGNLGAGRAA